MLLLHEEIDDLLDRYEKGEIELVVVESFARETLGCDVSGIDAVALRTWVARLNAFAME